nr:hypothetical protein GCM10020093_099940 [Planobispora longispora]
MPAEQDPRDVPADVAGDGGGDEDHHPVRPLVLGEQERHETGEQRRVDRDQDRRGDVADVTVRPRNIRQTISATTVIAKIASSQPGPPQ